MTTKMNLHDCIRLAEFAHFHQTDKAGHPYIEHPKRVLKAVQTHGAPPYVQMAAVLHDVTEDTPFTPEMLLTFGVPEAAVEIVKLVDRGHSEKEFAAACGPIAEWPSGTPLEEWREHRDKWYYEQIRNNGGAKLVKVCDIGDNTLPWRLSYLPVNTQLRLRAKYDKALNLINGVTV